MTIVIHVRRFSGWATDLPGELRRSLSPGRVAIGVTLAALIIAPSTAYLVERGNHNETLRYYRSLSVSSTGEIEFLKASLRELLDEQDRLTERLLDSGAVIYSGNKVQVKVVATGYTSSIFETDTTPYITAANTPTREGILALSRDLLREYTPGAPFSFGDRVHVSGFGDFLVEDVMNARWSNRADVWFASRLDAIDFGLREVYLTGTLAEDPFTEADVLTENTTAAVAHNEM
ncbi:MAG: hypothetical protein P8181_01845 [bacterium]